MVTILETLLASWPANIRTYLYLQTELIPSVSCSIESAAISLLASVLAVMADSSPQ